MKDNIYIILLTIEIFILVIFTTITVIFYNKIKFNLFFSILYILSQIISIVCQIYYLANYEYYVENSYIYNNITYAWNLLIIFLYTYYLKCLYKFYKEITTRKYYENFNDVL